jgi:hypothetical protein
MQVVDLHSGQKLYKHVLTAHTSIITAHLITLIHFPAVSHGLCGM